MQPEFFQNGEWIINRRSKHNLFQELGDGKLLVLKVEKKHQESRKKTEAVTKYHIFPTATRDAITPCFPLVFLCRKKTSKTYWTHSWSNGWVNLTAAQGNARFVHVNLVLVLEFCQNLSRNAMLFIEVCNFSCFHRVYESIFCVSGGFISMHFSDPAVETIRWYLMLGNGAWKMWIADRLGWNRGLWK